MLNPYLVPIIGAISSLVLATDMSTLPRWVKEPADGASISLAGRIDPKEMGSRAQRQVPKALEKKKKAYEKAKRLLM